MKEAMTLKWCDGNYFGSGEYTSYFMFETIQGSTLTKYELLEKGYIKLVKTEDNGFVIVEMFKPTPKCPKGIFKCDSFKYPGIGLIEYEIPYQGDVRV